MRLTLIFCWLVLVWPVFAQQCDEEIDAKALKFYEKGTDRKNDKYKRLDYLKKALEIEPDYVAANFALAIERIKTARYEGGGYGRALDNLLSVAQECPAYHSDVFYYLGAIYMGQQEFVEAAKYQKLFLDFLSDEDSKFSRDYPKKLEETKKDYEYASFFAEAYANPVPFNPEKVLEASTDADEYLPLISPDNEKLYFTRKSEVKAAVKTTYIQSDDKDYIEQFIESKYQNELFSVGQPLPRPFNEKKDNYGGAAISLDNREIILTVCRTEMINAKPYNNCDLYTARYVFGFDPETETERWHWTPLKNLGENVNTRGGWESQPSLSGDGKTLYFASFREDSKGIDIYKCSRKPDGSWGEAQNLGEPINTEFHDKSPFIHSDSQTLYYSSQGNIGFGGFDIFYSKMNDDGSWTKPTNIGYPINSSNDEHGFVVATNGKDVYFSSDQVEESSYGLDLYSFELYKEARPEKVAFIKGKAIDELGQPVSSGTVKLRNTQTNEVQEFAVDSSDGNFAAIIAVKDTEQIVLSIETKEKTFNAQLIPTDAKEDGTFNEIEVKVEKLKPGKSFALNNIYYETNSAELKPSSYVILEEFARFLNQEPTLKVEIRGHTDNVGSKSNNLALSSDRAFSVMAKLQELGVDGKRLSFKGFGPTQPIADNSTREGRAQNRRTEFYILK